MPRGLLNHAATKAYILERVKQHRPGWSVTRIAPSSLVAIEGHLRNYIDRLVHTQPAIGKTFRP